VFDPRSFALGPPPRLWQLDRALRAVIFAPFLLWFAWFCVLNLESVPGDMFGGVRFALLGAVVMVIFEWYWLLPSACVMYLLLFGFEAVRRRMRSTF